MDDRLETAGKSGPQRLLILTVVVGLLSAIAFVLVGIGAEDPRFGWEPAAVSATAVATASLAVATFWLGFSTAGDVRASNESARASTELARASTELAALTQLEQERRERPVLTLTSNYQQGDAEDFKDGGGTGPGILFQLRNEGPGEAFDVVLTPNGTKGQNAGVPRTLTHASIPPMPPGERMFFWLRLTDLGLNWDLIPGGDKGIVQPQYGYDMAWTDRWNTWHYEMSRDGSKIERYRIVGGDDEAGTFDEKTGKTTPTPRPS